MADPYFSEIKYLGNASEDFIEVAVDPGTDVSDLVVTIYQSNGTVRSSNPLAGLTPTSSGGKDVYVIALGSPPSFNGVAKQNAVSLSDDSTVYSFVSFDDRANPITARAGPANGLTSTQIGQAGRGESLESNDGSTYTVQPNPTSGSVPCLTAGTHVATPDGPRLVEELAPGDSVLTRDGPATLRAVFKRSLTRMDLMRAPRLLPVRIRAGALGAGIPSRDLLVSRQHRMLIRSQIAQRMFGTGEVLVAAIRLTALPGIDLDREAQNVTYLHLVFDHHAVIFAERAPTESLLLGPEACAALPAEQRSELNALFPGCLSGAASPAARIPSLPRQKRLIARHAKNAKPVLM